MPLMSASLRGKANVHPMTAEVALALGQAIVTVPRVPGGEQPLSRGAR